ncbi:hypothetical protein PLEOSDRAFT_1068135 [Pleurotus ostreatus PC15]|uniref:DUF6593 domain-containing protein n=1 Tax=Pleurotus ostreatus (strain PC15) TaxID=1137138 RepID=A0A067N4V4_PLEO1|nr:hypothetical protein PLEOSDRAFT_1068135 [Pleurotus ostreatus PC15]
MKLLLNSRRQRNCTLALEDGQAIYKITTPFKVTGRVTTILRVVPSAKDKHDDADLDARLQDKFAHLAEIEWQYIKSSRLRFRGDDIDTGTLFRKFGLGPYGRHRAFTAPDGREYVWKMGMWASELYVNDGSDTTVACFHGSSIGFLSPTRDAYLEIYPEGRHIKDVIVMTFIYVEKLRRDKKQAAQ